MVTILSLNCSYTKQTIQFPPPSLGLLYHRAYKYQASSTKTDEMLPKANTNPFAASHFFWRYFRRPLFDRKLCLSISSSCQQSGLHSVTIVLGTQSMPPLRKWFPELRMFVLAMGLPATVQLGMYGRVQTHT